MSQEAVLQLGRNALEMSLILAGPVLIFGLVAGLAWNDAISALIAHWFPIERNSILAKFIYAAAVTVVVVLITTYVVRLLRRGSTAAPRALDSDGATRYDGRA